MLRSRSQTIPRIRGLAGLAAIGLVLGSATAAANPVVAPADAPGSWTWPVRGEVVTAFRNGSDPYAAGQHRGIDIAAAAGTPVVAAAAGTVTYAGGAGTSGLIVAVRTADARFDTSYLHLSSLDVRAGDEVAAGARLGALGVTGRRSHAAPHLHFGVREAGSRHAYRDPLQFLGSPAPPVSPPPVPPLVPMRSPLAAPPVSAIAPGPVPAGRPAQAASVPASAPALGHAPRLVPGANPVGMADRRGMADSAPALPAPAAAGRRHPSPVYADRSAALGPDLGTAPAGAVEAGRAPEPGGERRRSLAQNRGGLDLGRMLALLGLLAAAALAVRPAERRAAAERGRLAIGLLLRPLAGRR